MWSVWDTGVKVVGGGAVVFVGGVGGEVRTVIDADVEAGFGGAGLEAFGGLIFLLDWRLVGVGCWRIGGGAGGRLTSGIGIERTVAGPTVSIRKRRLALIGIAK